MSHASFSIVVRCLKGGTGSSRLKRERSVDQVEGAGTTPVWLPVARAALAKKAANVRVLDLREVTTFTDFFIICTGANPRQIRAIAEEVVVELKQIGERAFGTEGLGSDDWVLLDYGDFVVHVFSEDARRYYDLERLWRHARVVDVPELS
jgi:ribosome-associated protein